MFTCKWFHLEIPTSVFQSSITSLLLEILHPPEDKDPRSTLLPPDLLLPYLLPGQTTQWSCIREGTRQACGAMEIMPALLQVFSLTLNSLTSSTNVQRLFPSRTYSIAPHTIPPPPPLLPLSFSGKQGISKASGKTGSERSCWCYHH